MEAGGAQGAAVRMSKEMCSRGIDAETWFIYKKAETYVEEEDVFVVYHKQPNTISDVLRVVRIIKKKIKENPPDGIISYTHYASTLGHIASWSAHIKNRVATMRNPLWTYPRGAKLLNKWMGANRFYTKIIAVSDSVKISADNYSVTYKKNITVVYNGVPSRISQLDKLTARKKFGFDFIGDKRLLINVGRLHPQKNQQLLIRMVAELQDYHLAIAGDGELRDELHNLIRQLNVSDRVHIMGEVNPDDIPDFLRCGDVFLFPSLYEAFGFAIFEAGHNDLPVIASNIPSTVEVLTATDKRTAGIIVETLEMSDWLKAIHMMEQKEVQEQCKLSMQEKLRVFDFNKMVDLYIHYATINT